MQDTIRIIVDSLAIKQDIIQVLLKSDNSFSYWIGIGFPIAVVVISIFSLILNNKNNKKTLNQTTQQHINILENEKDYNKRSVKPIIDFGTSINQKDKDGNYYFECDLHNKGLGPGIINKVHYVYEGKKFNTLKEIITEKKIIKSNQIIWNKSKFTILEKYALGAKENYILFRITLLEKPENNPQFVNSVLIPLYNLLKKVTIMFYYKSIYEEEFPAEGLILSEDISIDIFKAD